MPNQLKFLDFTGTQYLVNKIKAIDAKIPTSQEINTMISTALETFEQGLVTIVASLDDVTSPEEGKLYLVPDTNESSGDVYTVWTWEKVSGTYKWVQMGACTFTLVVDSALSDTSTNPVQNKVVTSALNLKANASDVHDATLTIQKNGVNVQTFSANASSNATCNITVPTSLTELTDDYLTSITNNEIDNMFSSSSSGSGS